MSSRLVTPAGGTVLAPPARSASGRVATEVCYSGRSFAEVSQAERAALAGAGWSDVKLAPHPTAAERANISAVDGDLRLTGIIERGHRDDCAGVYLTVGVHQAPAEAGPRRVGPSGPGSMSGGVAPRTLDPQ